MKEQSVSKNTAYLTIAYIGQKLLAFVYFVFVARALSVEDLGKYSFALSFTTLFAVLADIGLTQALIRESAKIREKASTYLSSILSLKVFLSVAVYAIVVLAVNLMNYPLITKQLVYLSGFIMVMDQFTNTFWGVFRGQRNLRYEAVGVIVNQVIVLISGAIILLLKMPLLYLMLPYFLGSVFNLLYSSISVRRTLGINFSFTWQKQVLFDILVISIPFALIVIFSRIYGYMDTVLLSYLVGDHAVAIYNVAMKIPFALQFIPAALAAAIFPAFSHQFIHDREQLRRTFERVVKFLIIMVVPITFGVATLARPIMLFFYKADYLPAVLPLQILMAGLFFVFLNFPLGSLLNGCNRQVTNTVLMGSAMVVNVGLNLWLIPQYSFVGAAAAFVFCHGTLFVISLFIAHQIAPYQKLPLLIILIKALICAGLMSVVLELLLGTVNVIVLVLIGAVVYAGAALVLRMVSDDEWSYIKGLLGKKSDADINESVTL